MIYELDPKVTEIHGYKISMAQAIVQTCTPNSHDSQWVNSRARWRGPPPFRFSPQWTMGVCNQ